MAQWSIPLQALADKAKADLATVAKKVTFQVFTNVVLRSPVDTGRFRANWNASLGSPDASTTPSTDRGRGAQQAARALTFEVGNVAYLTNGLPYARKLEYGYSKQAPTGVVRITAQEFAEYVRRAVAP